MKARSDQNIFDLADQYFGDLNHVVAFAVDNDFTLNQVLPIDQELVINNPVGVGDDNNKEAIVVQGLSFNNDQVT